MDLAGGAGQAVELLAGGEAVAEAPAPAGDGMAPWLDTEECTACDECVNLNPEIFAYNENQKALIKDAGAGPYRDLVKAAERCTAQVIHPGLPRDRSEKDVEKWIKRAEKYN
jgi:pyruvate-ferredoxin/flavodoxin oxidoreductase